MSGEVGRIVRDLRAALCAEAELAPADRVLLPRAAPRLPLAEPALERLADRIRACTRCPLHRTRRNAVPGEGPFDARLMLVGEAPGGDEDRQGRPFVGKAGEMLTRMLLGIKVGRDEVFIANVLKCRPPGNRDPEGEEIAHCRGYLTEQIGAIRPQVILTLGRFAAQLLLGTRQGILKIRGMPRDYDHPGGTAILFPTLHPSYLDRNPAAKREAWEDLKAVHRILREKNGDWPPPY